MMQHGNSTEHPLPENPYALNLQLSFPARCRRAIQEGFESEGQDDKWSTYCEWPWVEIWRPSRDGIYAYAVKLRTDKALIHVVDSWASARIMDPDGLGSDPSRHREIVTFVMDAIAGYAGESFDSPLVSGRTFRGIMGFSGEARSLEDVEMVAKTLRLQMTKMLRES